MSKRQAEAEPQPVSQPKKHASTASVQSTLFKFFDTTSVPSSSVKMIVDVTPESLNLKIYSKEEIEGCTGMKKAYMQFWNDKARELCKDKTVQAKMKSDKKAIMGAINCSWTLHRTEIIQLQAEEILELASKAYPDEVTKEYKLTSIRKNIDRVKEAHEATTLFYHIMSESPPSELKGMEDDLSTKLHELKVAQEALLKAIQRKKEDIFAADNDEEPEFLMTGSPVQLSAGDVEALVEVIKEDTQLEYEGMGETTVDEYDFNEA